VTWASGEHFLDDFAVHVRQAEVAAHVPVSEPRVIEAKAVEDRRLKIMDVDRIFYDIETKIVGLS